jgi:phasin family protein
MFTTIPKQFSVVMKPYSKLLEINAKSVEELINLQKVFLTAVSWEVAAQTKTLSTQTDLGKAIDDQQYYSDQLQEKVSTSAQDAYKVVTQSSEQVANFVEDTMSEVANLSK